MELSTPISLQQLHNTEGELTALFTLLRSLIALEQLGTTQDAVSHQEHPDLRATLRSALQLQITTNACRLFGLEPRNPSWIQVTLEQKALRERIYAQTQLYYESWHQLRRQLQQEHNDLLRDLTPHHHWQSPPNWQTIRTVVEVVIEWLRELYSEHQLTVSGPFAEADYVETLRAQYRAQLATLA